MGTIDSTVGGKNVGLIIDHYNKQVDEKKVKQFNRDINDRNIYYWKLWKRVADEINRGARQVKKLVPKRFF